MSELKDVFIGRQPIMDGDQNLFAYELLFRNSATVNHAEILGSDSATAQVMLNAFGEIGLVEVVGNAKAFVNFTEGLLDPKYESFFPKNQIVIEVLGSVVLNEKLMVNLKILKERGFKIALDDFILHPELKPLRHFADIIKINTSRIGPKDLSRYIEDFLEDGMILLAEKVESLDQYEFCKNIGFKYFQGYFFAKPKIIQGKALPTNRLHLMEVLSKVYDPDVDMRKLSDAIASDISLSQKLLKFASSTGRNQRVITSIHDAVMQFGLARLQSWVSMVALAGIDDKPLELFRTALIRAKFCELIGERNRDFSVDTYFTVGLFSCLDALMGQEMGDLLKQIRIAPPITMAILNHDGELGLALKIVLALEAGETIDFELPQEMTGADVSALYVQAMAKAQEVKIA